MEKSLLFLTIFRTMLGFRLTDMDQVNITWKIVKSKELRVSSYIKNVYCYYNIW